MISNLNTPNVHVLNVQRDQIPSKGMRQLLPSLNPPSQLPTPSPPPSLPQHQTTPPVSTPILKLSRRALAAATVGSSLPLLLPPYFCSPCFAQPNTNVDCTIYTNSPTTKKAFMDISIDGEPAGRVVVGLFGDDAPFGSSRFISLATGRAGISYRRKEFVKIMPNYIQHIGVRSYGVDVELANRTGSDLIADSLVAEWEAAKDKCPSATKNVAGSVGIVIRDPTKPPPKLKLVARKGKLEVDEEEVGKDPNGTEFVISTKDSPELDASTLVVGRVLEGMDVVERISKVKTVQENTGSPYFRVAKLIGDKRAVVAERGFNRPYSKIIITNCGLIE
ncbi:peptidyl-prolyl cis-trans isomerase CYP26-2, chloroplastic [Typha angustifolia]|uniref:peptidyl-prolyl cis-trans isomerase CYP26-2, chloroplastic n=1 Tax=Typha angustifolia TaxID=59011 RepID=UPI003C2AD400